MVACNRDQLAVKTGKAFWCYLCGRIIMFNDALGCPRSTARSLSTGMLRSLSDGFGEQQGGQRQYKPGTGEGHDQGSNSLSLRS